MTAERVMVQFVLAYLGTFTTIAIFFLAVGVLLGVWIGASWQRGRRTGRQVEDEHLMGVWNAVSEPFTPGVAKVGD